MTDLGTADRIFVCGPDCKAIKAPEEPVGSKMPWWEKMLWVAFSAVMTLFAVFGAFDIGVRAALHYWHF